MTNFYKVVQENIIEMCFPFNQWIMTKQDNIIDKILRNKKKVDKIQQEQQQS